MCRVTRVGSHSVITIRKTKRPTWGRFALLAERVGFEPTEGLTLRRFSRPVPSTARPYLHELFAYARRDARATTPVLLRASCPSPLRGQRLRRCSLRLPACAVDEFVWNEFGQPQAGPASRRVMRPGSTIQGGKCVDSPKPGSGNAGGHRGSDCLAIGMRVAIAGGGGRGRPTQSSRPLCHLSSARFCAAYRRACSSNR
jgi:hypothetical protein